MFASHSTQVKVRGQPSKLFLLPLWIPKGQSSVRLATVKYLYCQRHFASKSLRVICSPGWPQTHYLADGLDLLILLSLTPEKWDYR